MTEKEKVTMRYELMLKGSGMAKRERITKYLPNNAEIKKLMDSIDSVVADGKNIYIWSSKTGNGKTMAACALLKAYAYKTARTNVYGNHPIAIWNFNELMTLMKEEMNTEGLGATMIKNTLKEADLVVIDDCGIKPLSEYDKVMLYDIINYRFKEMKATIVTSNVIPRDAGNVFGKQIASRMVRGAIRVEIMGEDKR